MTTHNIESQETNPAPASLDQPGATPKANTGAGKPHVAPSKSNTRNRAAPAAKRTPAPQRTTKAKSAVTGRGTKTEKVLDLLKRRGGATLKDLMKATGWQAHSVRGLLSGTIGKKMRRTVKSAKGQDGKRSYSIKD